MRRYNPPFNGKRYVLNHSTHEVHDLDVETSDCRINTIKNASIFNCNSFEQAEFSSIWVDGHNCDGCYYCMLKEYRD